MEIKRSGSQPSTKGPADWFTGALRIHPMFASPAPLRVAGNAVIFAPGDKHWRSAAPETVMTCIAIQEALDGKAVEWLEQVSDRDVRG